MDNIDIPNARGVLRELYPEIDDRFFDWLCDNGYFTDITDEKIKLLMPRIGGLVIRCQK